MLRQSCTHTHTHIRSHTCLIMSGVLLWQQSGLQGQQWLAHKDALWAVFVRTYRFLHILHLLHLYEVMVAVKGRVWVLVPVWAAAGPLIYDVTPHQERQRRDRIWWIGAAELRDEHGPGQKSRTFTFSHIYCLRKLRLISCEEINTATV